MSKRSKVVIKGFEAKFYDELLNTLTLWQYPKFIWRIINKETEIENGDKVAELGVGNGRNAILFSERVGARGKVVGFDISKDMIEKALKKTKRFPNIEIVHHSILKPYPKKYHNFFDITFTSFVFHGLEDEEKEEMLKHLTTILKPNGKFYVLDYNQIELEKTPFYYKYFIKKIECPLASEFLSYPIETELRKHGLILKKKYTHFKNLIAYSEFVYSPHEIK